MLQMRAVSLTGYAEVASLVGLDGPRMLRAAGLAPEALKDPENRIPADKALRLLEDSARLSGGQSVGLLMAECRSFASLGPLSLLFERLPNTRAVIAAAMTYRDHLNDIFEMGLEDQDDMCLIHLDLVPGVQSVQATDMLAGLAYRSLTAASRGRWRPQSVHLRHKAPRDLSVWRRIFPLPVEFESDFDGFCSTAAAMEAPYPLADETMASHARGLLQRLPRSGPSTPLSDRVARAAALLMPVQRAGIEQVAAQLSMSSRSLQRHLAEEGTSFAQVLAHVRRERATDYLANSDRPITAVAGLLGYSNPSSFTRWFAGEFGSSPQAWRARQREPGKTGPPPIWRAEPRG